MRAKPLNVIQFLFHIFVGVRNETMQNCSSIVFLSAIRQTDGLCETVGRGYVGLLNLVYR